jgi:membrane dipeptidase
VLPLPVRAGLRPPAPTEPAALAKRLGCSEEAVRLARDCELIDLHIDTFIPPRLWGYDPLVAHRSALLGRWWFGHLDLPRMHEGGLSGAMWSITTNPSRRPKKRWQTFQRNLAGMQSLVVRSGGGLEIVRTHAEYLSARNRGAHAVMVSIQGGNALEAAPGGMAAVPKRMVVRATVVHLTTSSFGETSSPLRKFHPVRGLTEKGAEFVRQCNAERVFVDLAHIGEDAFWQAFEVLDRGQPVLATHTGVDGPRKHWRNLTDKQIQAIADTGGTIGIIFSEPFLKRPGGPTNGAMVVEHMQHIINVAGEDFVSVGSDFDGMIRPPWDLKSGETYPVLVQHMLDAGWDEGRITKVLGGNFLRAFEALRPE